MLDAICCGGDARLLWTARRGAACRQFNSIPAGKDQHRPQPCYLCAAQQPGTNYCLKISDTKSSAVLSMTFAFNQLQTRLSEKHVRGQLKDIVTRKKYL